MAPRILMASIVATRTVDLTPAHMTMRPQLTTGVAAALLALSACSADVPTAAPALLATTDVAALATVSADARLRLLPALPAELQPRLADALTNLERARTVDDASRSLGLAAQLAETVADQPTASALALDLSALRAQLITRTHP